MSLTNDALVRILRQGARLEEGDAALVAGLPAHEVIILRDHPVTVDTDIVFLVLEGWLCGYQMAGDGRRQIHSFHLAGDIPNLSRMVLADRSCHYAALNACRLGLFRVSALRELCHKSHAVSEAVCRVLAVETKIAREWIANLGGRRSVARMAHLLCELTTRIDAAAGQRQPFYHIPLTQTDLGDALGLSTVHTNRVLQELRNLKLIGLANGHLAIPDRDRLAALSGFDPAYLHLKSQTVATA